MVKRSSSKRAYKKRRTVRKSRVIRRKTQQRKTQRGGGFTFGSSSGPSFPTMGKYGLSVGKDFLGNVAATMSEKADKLKGIMTSGIDKFNDYRDMSFQDKILSQLGAAFTVVLSVSKMISYIGTYIYIAKLMISNPEYAKQMFELKKQEIQAKNQELAACFETALKSIKPADSGAAPTPAPAPEAPKEESLADILVSRFNEFKQSPSKSQFLKDIAKKLIERKRAEIESLKVNQTTKGIYECLKTALKVVDEKKDEMGAEVEAAPIDDSKLDQAQEAAETQEVAAAQQTDEERKAALKAANIEANTAYETAKQNRDEAKKNFGNGPNLQTASNAASAAYEVALNAARAAKDGGVPENEVKYPKV
jgi:hypothetical protein